jgi:hypothetical protein
MHHHLHAHVNHARVYHAMIIMYAKDYVLLTSSFRFRFSWSCVYFKCSKKIAMREGMMKRVKKRQIRKTKRPEKKDKLRKKKYKK